MLLARETKAAHHDLLLHEPASVLTAVLPPHQALKVRKGNEGQQVQKDHKVQLALQAQQVQQVQQALLALRVQQVPMVQMALTVPMAQREHKDHRVLQVLRRHKEIQD